MNVNDRNEFVTVQVSRILPVKRWKVLRTITRLQNFERYMPNVKQCTVLEKQANAVITCWSIEVDGIPIGWKEKDEFDLPNFQIHFKAIEGDWEHFEGTWRLKDAFNGGTELTVEIRAKISIPLVTEAFAEVLGGLIRKNFEQMLKALDDLFIHRRYLYIRERHISDVKGFSVIGHPYNFNHLVRYFQYFKPDLKLPSREFLSKLFDLTPSYKAYDIKNFRSTTGKTVDGYFVMCPIIPDMLELNAEQVVDKVVEACKVSEKLGVGIAVLGGFTSIAGEMYSKELTGALSVPITTGNALTVAMVLDGIERAAELMEIDLSQANVVVIGGTGDIGSTVARVLSQQVKTLTITSRSEKNLMATERVLFYYGKAEVKMSRDNNEVIKQADIVVAAASVSNAVVNIDNFKSGAVICDVGYPKNISYTTCGRKDILIFSGGITALPSEFNLGFDIGLPSPNVLYGCFAEAIVLALEDRYENFSWGKGNITREKIDFIRRSAHKHGFTLAPFFWGNRLITEQDIQEIKKHANPDPPRSLSKRA